MCTTFQLHILLIVTLKGRVSLDTPKYLRHQVVNSDSRLILIYRK